MHAKTNRLPEKKEQQNEDQDGKKMPQKTIKLNGIVSNALVNIPCNINVVLVVFCLHMFVAAKQSNRIKRNCGKKGTENACNVR